MPNWQGRLDLFPAAEDDRENAWRCCTGRGSVSWLEGITSVCVSQPWGLRGRNVVCHALGESRSMEAYDVQKGDSGGLSDKESPGDLMRSYRWKRKLSRTSWNQELRVLSGMAAGESYLLSSEL